MSGAASERADELPLAAQPWGGARRGCAASGDKEHKGFRKIFHGERGRVVRDAIFALLAIGGCVAQVWSAKGGAEVSRGERAGAVIGDGVAVFVAEDVAQVSPGEADGGDVDMAFLVPGGAGKPPGFLGEEPEGEERKLREGAPDDLGAANVLPKAEAVQFSANDAGASGEGMAGSHGGKDDTKGGGCR